MKIPNIFLFILTFLQNYYILSFTFSSTLILRSNSRIRSPLLMVYPSFDFICHLRLSVLCVLIGVVLPNQLTGFRSYCFRDFVIYLYVFLASCFIESLSMPRYVEIRTKYAVADKSRSSAAIDLFLF